MTFGYLGYIWAILGCGLFSTLLFGTSLFLYALARRGKKDGSEPSTTVEALDVRAPRTPGPSDGAA
ncbi:MAG: hypothetical protein J0L92_33050 [Deltaproteobacteria bacterium]|nr:hypothetical protein [Deltaproteobacteria bacterium]